MSFQEYAETHGFKFDIRANKKVLAGVCLVAAFVIVATVISLVFAGGRSFAVNHASNLSSLSNPSNSSAASNGGFASTSSADVGRGSLSADEGAGVASAGSIVVHVTGCVVNPGVYELEAGARVADGIQAAGGLAEDAAEGGINQARVLSDSEQIVVPSKNDASIGQGMLFEDPPGSSRQDGSSASSGTSGIIGGKVNINVASAQQLQTVSGIGESTARKIIEYRDANGPFKSIDDLKNISGIGEKRLESMRDSICVG